jgi:uncharacterized membrane protein
MQLIIIIAVLGFLFSLYSFYVEKQIEKNKNYKAVCDVSAAISCSAAAKSDYSKVGGIANSIKGLVYYPLFALLALFGHITIIFYLSLASIVMTFYLIYVSYFKLKNYCIICSGIYIVNILLLYFSYTLYVG